MTNLEMVLIAVSTILSSLLVVSVYFNIKHGLLIISLTESIEEVLDMINQIDSGKKAIDSDRWRLLREELR